ncbi:hypothetical protein NST17_18655 [Caldifermentibacillus hisashii]|jgi:hypothetical protein|uniref:Uncharacterized protein n=1 Tax=Caldifermentibacillus hisashii TaxID=996558 RepID=A0ABU9K361_9BACI|nr:hypothetical protein [Caldifermentibacillus hisashii]
MNVKKGVIWLGIIDFFYLAIFFIYISSRVYLGYYPIGIVNSIALIACIIAFILFTKKCIILKKFKPLNYAVFIGYIISIVFMFYTLFIWYAFIPD